MAVTTTRWQGGAVAGAGDAALVDNWDNGLAFDSTFQIIIPKTSNQAITSNFGKVPARSTLTLTDNPTDTEDVTIDGKEYVFQTTLDIYDGSVLIGATASDSLDNLISAINLTSGAGSTYGDNTTVHVTVTAIAATGDVMTAINRTAGTGTISTAETLSNGSWTNSSGFDSGLNVTNMHVEKGHNKEIMTSGDPAVLTCSNTLKHEGTGTFYLQPSSPITHLVVNSNNVTNAVTLSGTLGGGGTIEIIKGHVINNITASQSGNVYLRSSKSFYTVPSTGGTQNSIFQSAGTADVNALITFLFFDGGVMNKRDTNISNLIMTNGRLNVFFASAGIWNVLGGILDMSLAEDLVLTIFTYDPNTVALLTNETINTLLVTRKIGE